MEAARGLTTRRPAAPLCSAAAAPCVAPAPAAAAAAIAIAIARRPSSRGRLLVASPRDGHKAVFGKEKVLHAPVSSSAPFLGLGRATRHKRRHLVVSASGGGSGSSNGAVERILGAVGYVLPLLDGMQYGRYVFAQFPSSEALFRPLFPLLRVYSGIPYANFVAFFALYLGLVRNPSFSRFVRFNAMQACVLDVLIVLPIIVQRILNPRSGFALDLLIMFYNIVFVCILLAVAFGVVSCLLGRTPRLPLVADAAENQLF